MSGSTTTCWETITAAANGEAAQRDVLARRYRDPVAAYLRARWAGSTMQQEVDDATQEVFVELFRAGGALQKAVPKEEAVGGFRALLYGVARNVALRFEDRRVRRREHQAPSGLLTHGLVEDESRLSQAFERAWAGTIMSEAAQRMAENAQRSGPAAQRRVDLLRLRFGDGLPIREIADRWQASAEELHHQYAEARREFRHALCQAVAFHCPDATKQDVESECARLLVSLQ